MSEPAGAAPAVAFVVPCHNEGDNARDTLAYLADQDYPDFEIIAINDGSRDKSAALLAASQITETVIPDVFTVVSTGKQWNDWGIAVEPRTAPDVATLPARRITLWNLADGRRIDLALPEDDSEVVHVFDNRQVLLRIHDKLFFAEIQDSKLTAFTLAAFDSAIPNVHWAFYSAR